tara:strand:+ start:78 stop:236 length:159 start_codon:yes stop_codon:yes gene_type:complete
MHPCLVLFSSRVTDAPFEIQRSESHEIVSKVLQSRDETTLLVRSIMKKIAIP